MKAVLLVSHGSRYPSTVSEIKGFVDRLKKKSDAAIVEYAFLDIASPNIPEGIQKCIDQGAGEVVVLLNFLNSGKHVDEDIPGIVDEARARNPGVAITVTKPIGTHEQIVDLFLDLIDGS